MTTGTRVLLTVIIAFATVVATSVGVTAAAIYRSGMVSVEVEGAGGAQYDVDLPAGLVNVALDLIPSDLTDEVLEAGGLPIEVEAIFPSVRAAWRALEKSPDFVLAEVKSPDGWVLVEKTGRLLNVRIESDGQRINVKVPLKTLRKLLG